MTARRRQRKSPEASAPDRTPYKQPAKTTGTCRAHGQNRHKPLPNRSWVYATTTGISRNFNGTSWNKTKTRRWNTRTNCGLANLPRLQGTLQGAHSWDKLTPDSSTRTTATPQRRRTMPGGPHARGCADYRVHSRLPHPTGSSGQRARTPRSILAATPTRQSIRSRGHHGSSALQTSNRHGAGTPTAGSGCGGIPDGPERHAQRCNWESDDGAGRRRRCRRERLVGGRHLPGHGPSLTHTRMTSNSRVVSFMGLASAWSGPDIPPARLLPQWKVALQAEGCLLLRLDVWWDRQTVD